MIIRFAALGAACVLAMTPVLAAPPAPGVRVAQAAAPAAAPRRSTGVADFGGAGNNKPINVEADKLEVYQKEGRAIYIGNVVAVQGETTMKCSQLTVYFDQSRTGAAAGGGAGGAGAGAAGADGDALKKLECKGPVSVVAKSEGKTQVATGANAVYDRIASIVTMTGNVKMSDGRNVSECATFTFNTTSGVANCDPVRGGRVRGVFEPGDEKPAATR